MLNFKSGLMNCIGAIISIPTLVLLIVFSCVNGSTLDIVSYTLFGSFASLYFLFSTLYFWIKNETCQNIFKRFVNIFKILIIFITYILITFVNIPENLRWIFLGLATGIMLITTIFSGIWKDIPKMLISILSVLTYIIFSIFLFILIFA